MPEPNLNYIGSSGWGVLPGGRYGRLTQAPNRQVAQRPEYAVYDVSRGLTLSNITREPFNGRDPGTGRTFARGVEVPTAPAIDPNSVDRYRPIELTRSPATATAQADLMEQFRTNADRSLDDFGSSLNSFRTDLNSARTAADTATNIGPTTAALTGAQQGFSGDLDESTRRYEQALADAAARERGLVTQANDLLPSYDTALNNILAAQVGGVQRNLSRYKMGTGTPRSLGSAESQILTRGITEAALPIEQARIQRRYDILSGMALPTEERIAGRNIAFAGGFLPNTAASRYASETTLANTLQGLRQQVAGMTYNDAVNFLRAQGVPAELQNQILSGEISSLAGLNQLEEASRYRGLHDLLGVQVSQPIGFNMSLPELPNYPTRYPRSNPGGLPASNAPVTIAGDRFGNTGLDQYGLGIPYRGINRTAPVHPYDQYAQAVSNAGGVPLDYRDWSNQGTGEIPRYGAFGG
jgi:hypothetical protein